MKDKFYTYLHQALILMIVILIPLVMLLMYEERFFWEQARLLTRTREEYATYELGLKRMIAERQRINAEETVSHLARDAKKKNDQR
jgi:cytochrome c-type biogenesis protein CcmH/NrfG